MARSYFHFILSCFGGWGICLLSSFLPPSPFLSFLLFLFLPNGKSSMFSLFIRKPILSRSKFIVQLWEAPWGIYLSTWIGSLALQGWAMGGGVRGREDVLSPIEGIQEDKWLILFWKKSGFAFLPLVLDRQVWGPLWICGKTETSPWTGMWCG